MFTRDYKNSAPGEFFHIYNRGNAKEDVFVDENDFQFFLLRLRQNLVPSADVHRHFRPLPPESFDLIAYCLMPNHFHLLLKQNKDISTGKLLGKVCTSYGMYFNKKYKRVGHIFQDQFKQINIDSNKYLTWLSAYIHNNPVVAGLVQNPTHWRWSSYSKFTHPVLDDFISSDVILEQFSKVQDYISFVDDARKTLGDNIPESFLLDQEM